MPLMTPEYMELQKALHATGNYGKGVDAAECARVIREIAPLGASVLDYGCGQGHLGRLLVPDYDVREYDPCINGKDGKPEPADYVVCADVMEHVEPELVETVIAHLRELAVKRLVLVIATRPSGKNLEDGRNAHLIVESIGWWKEKFGPLFRLERWEDRSANGKGIFGVLEPSSVMGELKAIGVVADDERNEYTAKNIGLTWKRIPNQPQPPNGKTLIVCGYGPSIKQSWKVIKKQKEEIPNCEIASVSGGHDFLRKHDIKPDWHVECDPRPHKSKMIKRVRKGVKYLMASCCHPDFLKRIVDEGGDLILWHLFNGPETFKVRDLPSEREQILIPGGGSITLRTFVLFYAMGYRNFIVHGFDCSFGADGKTHAGPHSGKVDPVTGKPFAQVVKVRVEATDLWYDTAPVMITYAKHMIKDLIKGRFPGCKFFFMGDGLFQTMLKHSVDAINNQRWEKPPRDYFHLTEADVEPSEVWGEPKKENAA